MLKSSTLESVVSETEQHATPSSAASNVTPQNTDVIVEENEAEQQNNQPLAPSDLAAVQLAAGLMQTFEPPLLKVRAQLKELIGKQNKIYIDLSAEKYKLDNSEVANLHEMMNSVKFYREKLLRIKKQMQSIYQRSKELKKRAANIQTCKHKELQRKLQKQQQEEALIAKQQTS